MFYARNNTISTTRLIDNIKIPNGITDTYIIQLQIELHTAKSVASDKLIGTEQCSGTFLYVLVAVTAYMIAEVVILFLPGKDQVIVRYILMENK